MKGDTSFMKGKLKLQLITLINVNARRTLLIGCFNFIDYEKIEKSLSYTFAT